MDPKSLPAFPCPTGATLELEGVTLRDYFASKVMVALFAHAEAIGRVAKKRGVTNEEAIAADAYLMADAMLAARKQ